MIRKIPKPGLSPPDPPSLPKYGRSPPPPGDATQKRDQKPCLRTP